MKQFDQSRRFLLTGVASVAATSLILPGSPAFSAILKQTPVQTEGPFYPESWTGDIDNDLVVFKGAEAEALGKILHLRGKVSNIEGNPLASAVVEIWQCDSNGIYRHSGDARPSGKRDSGFQGYGRAVTDDRGFYSFRTIRPVAYSGRTPHIHFRVRAEGKPHLTTQMYIFGEPQNERDVLLRRIRDKAERDRLIVKLDTADRIETGALTGTFDIVLV